MLTHFLFVPNISPWQGWLFLTVAVITIAAGCISIYENRTHFSWTDAVMVLIYLWSGSFFSCLRYTGAWAYLNNNSVYCYTISLQVAWQFAAPGCWNFYSYKKCV